MFVIKTTNSEKIASSLVEILINRVKFIYSEKATNFCKISTVDLSYDGDLIKKNCGLLRIYELYKFSLTQISFLIK